MTLQELTATAYRVSNAIRVCARSLDADTPQEAGDDTATADMLTIARNMVGDVIDGLEALTATPHATPDGPASLYTQWVDVRAKQRALVVLNGGNDPKGCAEWDVLMAECESLCQRISDAVPQTNADAIIDDLSDLQVKPERAKA